MEIVEALWDSATFGYPVGVLTIPSGVSNLQVAQLLRHQQQFTVVYVFSDRPMTIDGLDLFDTRKTFAMAITDAPKHSPIAAMPFGRTVTAPIRQLAHLSGHHSRFRMDPQFRNGEFELLYNLWIEGSVSRVKAEEVLVTGTVEQPTGMITLERADDNTMRIGLISVSAEHWGKGIGKALIRAAINYAVVQKCQQLTVASQSANIRAIALYLSCGFHLVERRFTYHWWRK
jgi:dTDP-4-amino-4,6-dideoxy-D-galactose acyltransferase